MSTPRDVDRRFLSTVFGWLVSLPHDVKVLFEAKDEPNLEREARELAAGAILYCLTPDKSAEVNFAGFADSAILMREAMRTLMAKGGEGADAFKERFPEFFATLDDDLALCKDAMGDTYTWLAGKIAGLPKMTYKGKKLALYLDDDESVEILYEDGLAFATNYPIDEEKLGMRLKKPETLLDPLRRKAAEERKKIAQGA